MYKSREEVLEIEHKLLRQLVDRMAEEPVDAESVCSFFSGVVSMTDALFEKEGDG